jgi:hypothetical protein
MHVEVMRAAIEAHLDDPVSLALEFDQQTESVLLPWHEATTALDRRRLREMEAHIAGQVPEADPESKIGDLILASAARDATATRVLGDIFSCYATPQEVFARPGILDHLMSLAPSTSVEPIPGPDRQQLLDLLA